MFCHADWQSASGQDLFPKWAGFTLFLTSWSINSNRSRTLSHRLSVTANQRVNTIVQSFLEIGLYTCWFVLSCTTYVWPILEFNSVTWSPFYKGDTECTEKVQRRFTKWLATRFKSLSLVHHLHMFTNLLSLQSWAEEVACWSIRP